MCAHGDRIEMPCPHHCGRTAGDGEGYIVRGAGLWTGAARKRHSRMALRFRRMEPWRVKRKNKNIKEDM